jgi:hypothetical protein
VIQGQTVYYRLSEENFADVNHQRDMKATVLTMYDGIEHVHIFHGAPVSIGMVLPAEVVRCYSQYAYDRLIHPRTVSTRSKKHFSGFADIRVKLPGNDILWVPLAEMDDNPKKDGELGEHGVGYLTVPEVGKFTVVMPAPLI